MLHLLLAIITLAALAIFVQHFPRLSLTVGALGIAFLVFCGVYAYNHYESPADRSARWAAEDTEAQRTRDAEADATFEASRAPEVKKSKKATQVVKQVKVERSACDLLRDAYHKYDTARSHLGFNNPTELTLIRNELDDAITELRPKCEASK